MKQRLTGEATDEMCRSLLVTVMCYKMPEMESLL
jgi:hypothetical protein